MPGPIKGNNGSTFKSEQGGRRTNGIVDRADWHAKAAVLPTVQNSDNQNQAGGSQRAVTNNMCLTNHRSKPAHSKIKLRLRLGPKVIAARPGMRWRPNLDRWHLIMGVNHTSDTCYGKLTRFSWIMYVHLVRLASWKILTMDF